MATLQTSTSNFNQTVTALVLRRIEENLRDHSVYLQDGSYIKGDLIPGTNLIRHIAYGDMSVVAGTPDNATPTPPWLKEGIPPTEEALTIFYSEYGVNQAGRLVGITDVALAESPHNLMSVAAERVGTNAVQTLDLSVGAILHAGAARVLYAGAATTRPTVAATHNMTGALIRRAVAVLKSANIPTFPDGTYHAFIHPMVVHDLQGDTATVGGWWDVQKYASPENMLTGEVGKYMGVRFIETNVANMFANSGVGSLVDVYSTFIFGPDAFAFGDLQSISAYLVSPGGDHLDPLAQKALVGWKAMWGAKLMDITGAGNKYLRIEAASSIGANT